MRAVLLILFTAPLAASVIYSTGPSNLSGASDMSGQILAEDFTIATADDVTAVVFDLSATSFTPSSSSIGLAFFSDVSGGPGGILASATISAAGATLTGNNVNGNNEWRVPLTLSSPLFLSAGTYWVALRDGAWGTALNKPEVDWNQTDFGIDSFAMATTLVTGASGWTSTGVNLTFEIDGGLAPVPEPATWLTAGLALGGLAAARLRAQCE